MDSTLADALFLPWWKNILYFFAIALSIVAVRFSTNFDLNAWLEQRRHSRLLAEVFKASNQCKHAWTLYPSSQYSQCVSCQAWIATDILIVARTHFSPKPVIIAERPDVVFDHKGVLVLAKSYVGLEK